MTDTLSPHPSAAATVRLAKMSRLQIQREPWPAFGAFEPGAYPLALRVSAARQWWRRAREEYGSIHEFSELSYVCTAARAPVDVLGSLARLITDEVRHAALCSEMALTILPEKAKEEVFDWREPASPWSPAPHSASRQSLLTWAADAVMCSCCIGETVSRPLYEALATVITDPVPESVVRQILRDEHLHATFGWEFLGWLYAELEAPARDWLQHSLARRLRGFERACVVGGITLPQLVDREVVIEAPDVDSLPNLGRLSPEQYAMIFYATLEHEVLPKFEAIGFDSMRAWAERAHTPPRPLP